MTSPSEKETARECAALAAYLTGAAPDSYIARKYHEAHAASDRFQPRGRFDALLVRWATRGPGWASLTDTYACLFARRSALRKKLILLMAILESSAPRFGFSDRADAGSAAGFWLRLAARGVGFGLRLLAASVALAPLHLVLGNDGPPGRSR